MCSPFDKHSDECIGCNACVEVCPTGYIESVDDGAVRRLETWKTDVELTRCEACGKVSVPLKQLEFARRELDEHVPLSGVCPACRRSRTVECLAGASAVRGKDA